MNKIYLFCILQLLVFNNIAAQVNPQPTDSLINGLSVNAIAPPPPDLDIYGSLIFNYDAAGNQIYKGYEILLLVLGAKDTVITDGLNLVVDRDQLFRKRIDFSPNPVTDYLKVQINSSETLQTLRIFDLNGKLLHTLQPTSATDVFLVDFTRYSTGVYLVALYFDTGKKETFKIIRK